MCRDEPAREAMGAAARQWHADAFSPEANHETLMQIYRDAIARQSGTRRNRRLQGVEP